MEFDPSQIPERISTLRVKARKLEHGNMMDCVGCQPSLGCGWRKRMFYLFTMWVGRILSMIEILHGPKHAISP